MQKNPRFTVVDLFSGAGGMSFGFHANQQFEVIAAADAEIGKPTSGDGKLQCNSTYERNIGIRPKRINLAKIDPSDIRNLLGVGDRKIDVLSVCPPCTGFSRANPKNHINDDARNSLVAKSADFAINLDADVVVMENARELIRGNFSHHFAQFKSRLQSAGYKVVASNHILTKFGLPQIRERALVFAAKAHIDLKTLDDLWHGYVVSSSATTVRRALNHVLKTKNADMRYPGFASQEVMDRISAIPVDGGSWMDLLNHKKADYLLTGSMKRIAAAKKFGSYPDVYGRMAWDKPAQTIKRECAHIGNGRYAHPVEDRLCTVSEMAALNGFPVNFKFEGSLLSNIYRHIGDAVPPLVSYQISHCVAWALTGTKPHIKETLLFGCHLSEHDIIEKEPTMMAAE